MTTHLSTQEFVDAVEQALPADRAAHLAACAACRSEVETLREVLAGVEHAGEVPEPSPLFWHHFQQRVRAEVASEAARPAGWSWRTLVGSPGSMLAAGATVAAVVIAVTLSVPRPAAPGTGGLDSTDVADAPVTGDEAALDGAEWEFVTDVISTLDDDEVREVLAPSRHAMDAAFDSLTTAERDRFMNLLAAEMAMGSE